MAIEGTLPVTRPEEAGEGAAKAEAAAVLGGRSTAMLLMPIAAFVEALITILVMSSIGFIPPLVIFLVLLLAIGALALARPGRRVFLVGGIFLLAFVGLNLPFAIEGLIHPIGSSHAWTDMIALLVGIAGSISGFAAFVELRRGRPVVRPGRAPIGEALAILVVGALIGTTYVSVSGFEALGSSGGLGVSNGVSKAPTQAPVELDATGTVFTQKTLELSTGPGTIYVVNSDAGPHTFDIDLGGRHLLYPLPAHSTTAVVLDLTTAGTYAYWCSIPGHRASMEGTLVVAGS
jgi:plastocyanin